MAEDGILDLGEVEIPNWSEEMGARNYIPFREVEHSKGLRAAFIRHDVNFVRSYIRKMRYGEAFEPSKTYRIHVIWVDGETAIWEFDHTIGWPVEDGEPKAWHQEWLDNFEGVA